jgi:hypothetical protein
MSSVICKTAFDHFIDKKKMALKNNKHVQTVEITYFVSTLLSYLSLLKFTISLLS